MYKRQFVYIFMGLFVLFGTGCSTITKSEKQVLALSAFYEGSPVEPECELKNDKGLWNASAPSQVTVKRSDEDLAVTCKKEGLPDGLLTAISRTSGSMWGNIIFGGGVGALIDHSNGTAYNYPVKLPVRMGETVVVDEKDESSDMALSEEESE